MDTATLNALQFAAIGVNLGCIGTNAYTFRRIRGHRKAAADAHRRALEDAAAQPYGGAFSRAVGAVAGEEAGASVSAIPDLIEPIVGWRCWDVYNDGHLVALNAGTSYGGVTWEPRVAKQALCNRYEGYVSVGSATPKRSHSTGPHEGCTCGYYAAKLLAKAQWPNGNYAYGRVAMWGKVIEHEGGYRAEYAYPIEVILVPKAGYRYAAGGIVYSGNFIASSSPAEPSEISAWPDDVVENIRLRMATMYGVPVRIGSDDAMRDEWAAQYLDVPLPPQVVPLLEAAK